METKNKLIISLLLVTQVSGVMAAKKKGPAIERGVASQAKIDQQIQLEKDYNAYVNSVNQFNADNSPHLNQQSVNQFNADNSPHLNQQKVVEVVAVGISRELMTQADWLDSGRPRY